MTRFLALSRTTHGVLDIAAPAFCALLWLGDFPPLPKILLALATAFAAYTAVYALNDLAGMKCDREKFSGAGVNAGYSVEASAERYPVARDLLSPGRAWLWMGGWFILASVGSYLLNPTIVLVLIAAALLEVLYCRLLKVTHWRTLVSGLVKTSGPIAAVLAVDPSPSPALLSLLVLWLFLWEIGGQNIPADWNDTAEDRRIDARTIPVRFGFKTAGLIVVSALGLSVLVSTMLPLVSPARLGILYIAVSVLIGYVLLLRPGIRLFRQRKGELAARLFDGASYYPLAHLGLIAMFLMAERLIAA